MEKPTMERRRRPDLNPPVKLIPLLLAMGVVGVLAYASMYLIAMSPMVIRVLGPMLTSG